MSHSPTITVIVVSDFEPSTRKTWADEQAMLAALLDQDIDIPFDILLVENQAFADSVPDAIHQIAPRAQILFSDQTGSARLKDVGVAHTDTELLAVLEADAIPNRAWLRTLVTVLNDNPHIDAVSGRTLYGEQTGYRRCLNLIDRAFDDLGEPGESPFISNNGALYRRAVLEDFPYPDAVTPFLSSRLRNARIVAAGHRFYFHPDAQMQHAIGGLDFVRDVHRNVGYADMMMRAAGSATAIPGQLWRRTRMELADLARLGRRYLRWHDLPLLIALMLLCRLHEIPGALDAIRRRDALPNTSYR